MAPALRRGAQGLAAECGGVQGGAAPPAYDQTKPFAAAAAASGVRQGAATCNRVQQTTAVAPDAETNPIHPLTPQQVAAARLLAAGRTNRAAASELGINEHTVGRWRRRRDFAEELARQQRVMLSIVAVSGRGRR
jgi:FixJ family two-component response regulator